MTDAINIPSQDPADTAGLGAMLRSVIRKAMMQQDGMLPAVVVSATRPGRAVVRPAIQMVSTGGDALPRAQLFDIPVLALGGGGFCINWPLKPGDTGWIEASDRDIGLWLQGGGAGDVKPNSHRIHSFSDGRFIPDALFNFTLPADGEGALCIQSLSGDVNICVGPDTIKMNAPGGVWINNIRMDTHVHGGVQSGPSDTAGPHN